MISEYVIRNVRSYLERSLFEYDKEDKIVLNVSKKLLNRLLFEDNKIAFDFEQIKKLNLSDACFDGKCVMGLDFTGSKGARINPQKVMNKSLYKTTLTDAQIIGSLDGVDVEKTNFDGCINTYAIGKKKKEERVKGLIKKL